jgi:glycine cleavage system protein P-like pyridoxal-binding family
MATVFWDRKGVLLIEFTEPGTTITSEMYCETLKKLHRAIQNKRRGMLTSGVVLLHDNTHPHTAACTHALLQQFRWDLFDHPPYSPDLAPSDFHVFMRMKVWLETQRFNKN